MAFCSMSSAYPAGVPARAALYVNRCSQHGLRFAAQFHSTMERNREGSQRNTKQLMEVQTQLFLTRSDLPSPRGPPTNGTLA